jgi:hypothetical protein
LKLSALGAQQGEVEVDLTRLWQQARAEIELSQPSLAAVMSLAQPERLDGNNLLLKIPAGQKINHGLLNDGQTRVEAALSKVLGRPARIQVELETSPKGDPALKRLKSVFDLEEVE